MSGTLHKLHADPLLTKRELAAELKRSERWIELRQRDGLPVADTDRFGRRRYRLEDVQRWLHEAGKPRSATDRIRNLEAQVARLTAIVERLDAEAA